MKRYLQSYVKESLSEKIVLLTGPRQCGKTTLSKDLYPSYDYFNYDNGEDRLELHKKSWDRNKPLIIFDELHKKKDWKRWLKGIYDKEGTSPHILVTGSAKLDTYRKVGDSLAGRYFQYSLYPLDLKEAYENWSKDNNENFSRLWHCGGFLEPFVKGSETYYKRWTRTHLDIILRQDLIDLHAVRDIQAIETLVMMLKQRVGQCISYANLARDLERDANTIKRWLQMLENLYVIFRVNPYHKNISRSLLREPKYYFYDIAQVEGEAARLENLVALALLKELNFIADTTGAKVALNYLRTKDGKELDFSVSIDNKITYLIEVKLSDDNPASGFQHFLQFLPHAKTIQLVKNIRKEKTFPNGVAIRNLVNWLINFDLS